MDPLRSELGINRARTPSNELLTGAHDHDLIIYRRAILAFQVFPSELFLPENVSSELEVGLRPNPGVKNTSNGPNHSTGTQRYRSGFIRAAALRETSGGCHRPGR